MNSEDGFLSQAEKNLSTETFTKIPNPLFIRCWNYPVLWWTFLAFNEQFTCQRSLMLPWQVRRSLTLVRWMLKLVKRSIIAFSQKNESVIDSSIHKKKQKCKTLIGSSQLLIFKINAGGFQASKRLSTLLRQISSTTASAPSYTSTIPVMFHWEVTQTDCFCQWSFRILPLPLRNLSGCFYVYLQLICICGILKAQFDVNATATHKRRMLPMTGWLLLLSLAEKIRLSMDLNSLHGKVWESQKLKKSTPTKLP